MRNRIALLLSAAMVLAAFAAAPALAEGDEDETACTDLGTTDDGDAAQACEATYYLSCDKAEGNKVQEPGVAVPLTAVAPDTSYTAGGGCGTPEIPVFSGTVQNTPYDFEFAGIVDGNIDTLTVELHDIHATQARLAETHPLDVRITISGHSPFGSETNTNVTGDETSSPLTHRVDAEVTTSSTGASDMLTFTVTNIAADLPQLVNAGEGKLALVVVTIGFDAEEARGLQVPVWGASEIASSLTMNGEVLGTVVDATRVN